MTDSSDLTSPTGAAHRRGPLRAGQRVQLTDERGRMATITLVEGGEYHSHQGVLFHDEIIGQPDAVVVHNSAGHPYQILRPLLKDFVLSMPRGATVVYPKDAGQIITMADIFPGASVVEAGVGSGALSISLLRAIGDHGYLASYERREDFATIAQANVETFFGKEHPAWSVHIGDFQDTVTSVEAPGSVDRVVLDMLAPWECIDAVATVMAPGGVWINYVTTVPQLSKLVEAVRADGRFTEPESFESMVRGWHVQGLAVRPDHRMVAHTGFLMTCRRLADAQQPLELKRRNKEAEFSAEDIEAWTPAKDEDWSEQAQNIPPVSERKVRRSTRDSAAARKAAAHAQDSIERGESGKPETEQKS
ncbi:tRNA (adenine-N1)-methyltransferase [Micrococcoides hystricis]|uniref:tRNA (Adenine-N1)-methyltransferase n=1 Tax=Micrococcoides hystricis TaxID=1572761 RepID=A0ABV6P8Q4_9MICC